MPLPNPAFARFVRMHSRPTTVYRRDDTTSSSYGNAVTYTELSEERDVFVAGLEESQQFTGAGERQAAMLVAYTDTPVDLQVNDRIDHGTQKYEVLTKEGAPSESDPAIYRYSLDNV